MASNDHDDTDCFAVTWSLENVSYCWHTRGQEVRSPAFVVQSIQDTKWTLMLFPRAHSVEKFIAFYLRREADSRGADEVRVYYELSFVAADGSSLALKEATDRSFKKGYNFGYSKFQKQEEVFSSRKDEFLTRDTLTMRCRMWRCDGKVTKPQYNHARTVIQGERIAFVWAIEKFSSLQPYWRNTLEVRSPSREVLAILDLYLAGGPFEEEETVNIRAIFRGASIKFLTFKCYLLDSVGNVVLCGRQEFGSCSPSRVGEFSLLQNKDTWIEYERLHSKNDVLSLQCGCAFSSGIAFEGMKRLDIGAVPSLIRNLSVETVPDTAGMGVEEELDTVGMGVEEEFDTVGMGVEEEFDTSARLEAELVRFLDNGIFWDMRLRTDTETFHVHENILSAESPVFQCMFASGMKETIERCVDMPEFDTDTVRRMLLYMYSGTLENLSLENASKLYAAADMYGILVLKKRCSSVLKSGLCESNASKILVLADRYCDEDLKRASLWRLMSD